MSRAELVVAIERCRHHLAMLEGALEVIDLYAGAGGIAPGARAPRDRREDAPKRRGRVEKAVQARSSAQPVETGKNGEPPSAARSSAKRPPRAPRPTDIPRGQRWCGTCETVKPRSEFAKDTSKPDGLQIRCKPCSREACRLAREKKARLAGKVNVGPVSELALVDEPARRAAVPGSGEATKRKALIRARMKAARAARRNKDDDAPEADFDGELPVSRELFG